MSAREYAKLAPTFWTGDTGKKLRRRGSEALIVAVYLISAPSSNMIGLYYQPILFMAHETGLGIEGASKGLRDCIECGFCSYDEESEMVWVHEMAAWQIADALKGTDKRCAGIQKDYDNLAENPFLGPFFDRYAKAFHLTRRRSFEEHEAPDFELECEGASQAPSKPLRSQEQEQEQEQESRRASPRGSRLPHEELPEDWRAFCQSERPDLQPEATFAKFADYWRAQPGAKGRKLDWLATWRNWVREERARPRVVAGGGPDPWAGAI